MDTLSLGRDARAAPRADRLAQGRGLRRGGGGDGLRPRHGRRGGHGGAVRDGLELLGAVRGRVLALREAELPGTVFVAADALAVLGCARRDDETRPRSSRAFAASVVFMLLPSGALSQAGALIAPLSPGVGESGLRKYASRRVEGIARAYLAVSDAAEKGCGVRERQRRRPRLRPRGRRGLREMRAPGRVLGLGLYGDARRHEQRHRRHEGARAGSRAATCPTGSRSRCENLAAFVAAVNGELRAQYYRAEYRERLRNGRAAAWGQYRDFAEILAQVSAELGSLNGADPLAERRLMRYLRSMDIEADAAVFRDASGRLRAVIESGSLQTLTRDAAWLDRLSAVLGVRLCTPGNNPAGRITLLEAEPLCASVGVAARRREGESVSGDRGTFFKTDAGVLCVILSDGMGSGEAAAGESAGAVGILERFLRSGVDPAAAMKVLGSVMLLRSGADDWGCATADLLCVDLFTGEAGFYKYGAAPSYVKNGRSVRRIDCESFAAGLLEGECPAPDAVHMTLRPGSVALIASDGVVSGADDAWLRETLAASEDPDMKALARQVLRCAMEREDNPDDMTVLAVRVDERA